MPLVKVFYTLPKDIDFNKVVGKGITDVLSTLKLCEYDPARIFFMALNTDHSSCGGIMLKQQIENVTLETSSYYVEVNLASGSTVEQRRAICSKVTDIIAACGIPIKNIRVIVFEYPAGVYVVGGVPV